MRPLPVFLALSAVCAASVAQQAPPPDPPSPITDRFALRADAFFGTVKTQARIDDTATATPGTEFSAEDDFHLSPRARQVRAEFMFRLRERNRLRVDMWQLTRDAVGSPPRTISYGASSFTPADVVASHFDWLQIDVTYNYSVLRSSRFELGAGLGLHLLQAEAEASVAARGVREDLSGSGPFATLALDGTWCITQRFALTARAQSFSLRSNSILGELGDYRVDLQFRWRPNLAFGVGYESTQTRLDVSNHDPSGLLRLDTRGPALFARASF
ncbi:MAG TPA: hypothetical protein VKC11_06265 [Steroidobacteraceae bacterium]|nr:hypothetical protein [Steroidobacteraceae bacterium]